jgi:hypothetical protein
MAASRKSVYIESSILSFLCADPSPVQATLEKQRDTIQWWHFHRAKYESYVSNEVIVEISKGDPVFAQRRLEKAIELPLIERVAQDRQLAHEFLTRRIIPAVAEVDATHLAIAVRTQMDYLLTWNLKHLANPDVLPVVYNYLDRTHRHRPIISTPSMLMESR